MIDVDRSIADLETWESSGNVISNYMRMHKLKNFYQRMDDEIEIQQAFPEVHYRYVITPKVQLDPSYQEMSLNHELI